MSLGARDTRSAIIFLIKTIDRSPSSARARAVIAVYREQKRVEKNTRASAQHSSSSKKKRARARERMRCGVVQSAGAKRDRRSKHDHRGCALLLTMAIVNGGGGGRAGTQDI